MALLERWPIAAVVLVAIVSVYRCSGGSVAACDRYAASPLDSGRPSGVPGVEFSEIDAGRALPACAGALAAHPSARMAFQLGRAQDAAGDYDAAFRNYRLAAERDYVPAQANIGSMYLNGNGVRQSDREAAKYFRLAAVQGMDAAQVDLGDLYEEGKGVSESENQAIRWYQLAAAQGNEDAKAKLSKIGGERVGRVFNGISQLLGGDRQERRRKACQHVAPQNLMAAGCL